MSIEFGARFTKMKRGGGSANAEGLEQKGFDRSTIRNVGCSFRTLDRTKVEMVVPLRLWRASRSAINASNPRRNHKLPMQEAGKNYCLLNQTRPVPRTRISSVVRHAQTLFAALGRLLEELWCPRNMRRFSVEFLSAILGRHGSLPGRPRIRSEGQQCRVLQRELSLGYSQTELPQYETQSIIRVQWRKENSAGMGRIARAQLPYRVLACCVGWLAISQGIAYAADDIPRDAQKYRRELTANARLVFGLNAPIATLAAQVQTESAFNADAVSPAGAVGLAQFMPSTASWISGAYSALEANEPKNPAWALRALATYDKYLLDRVTATTPCHEAAKMLSSYNGGLGNVQKEEALCKDNRNCDPRLWWENVERIKGDNRSWPNWVENRAYPPSILFVREPKYVKAGWGRGLCQGEAY